MPAVRLALAVAAKGGADATAFVEALDRDGVLGHPEVEVHLVRDGSARLDGGSSGAVHWRRIEGEASIFDLWAAGIAAASAPHVAVLDVRCPPAPGWLAGVLAGLAEGPEALFGPVEPEYPYTDDRMVGYLAEYVQFHRPIASGMSEVPGLNMVLRREVAMPTDNGFVKTLVVRALTAPLLRPDAVVLHRKAYVAADYRLRRYRHGRCYAAQRMKGPGAPPRLLAVLFTPALPALRVWRIHRHARRIEGCRRAFWRFLPALVAAEASWSWGEALGYLAGEGDCSRRLD